MPKVHNIGTKHFVQYFRFPVKWGWRIIVRGDTTEIDVPFRTAKPFMIRLPFYRVLVVGKWTGFKTEEDALNDAIGRRDLTYDDFSEEKGWQPAPDQDPEEGIYDIYA